MTDVGYRMTAAEPTIELRRQAVIRHPSPRIHGPVPPGRRMFDVSAAETIDFERAQGLRCIPCRTDEDAQLGPRA